MAGVNVRIVCQVCGRRPMYSKGFHLLEFNDGTKEVCKLVKLRCRCGALAYGKTVSKAELRFHQRTVLMNMFDFKSTRKTFKPGWRNR